MTPEHEAQDWVRTRELLFDLAREVADCEDAAHRDHAARTVALEQSIGRVTAGTVRSPVPVPHFDSSAMDGWAVSGEPPWRLRTGPPARAEGRNLHRLRTRLGHGEAVAVLTGSLLPQGCEGVVRHEHARVSGDRLEPLPEHPYAPGRDIRRTGEEMEVGAVLLGGGRRIGPRHLALFAACGVDRVAVARCPTVALGTTGNEVIARGIPGPGQVRDAFTAQFPALFEAWGARLEHATRLPDEPGAVEDWLDRTEAEVLVLTGGSGHSEQDYVRRALESRCEEVLVSSVAMRPGHPTIIGVLPPFHPDGHRRVVLGLPGNPLAAHVALYSFAPVLLAGLLDEPFPHLRGAVLDQDAPGGRNPGVRVLPCSVDDAGRATVLPRRSSHMLSGLARADALGIVAQGQESAGDPVLLLPLDTPRP